MFCLAATRSLSADTLPFTEKKMAIQQKNHLGLFRRTN